MDSSNIWLYLALCAMNQQLPPPLLVQQFMWSQAMLQMQHSYGSQGPPPYQYMSQQQPQYRSNSGAIRYHHHGSLRMTEVPTHYNSAHESSGMIASDHSTGTHPVNARMGADSSGAGKGRKKPYDRHPSGPSHTRGQRRGKEDLSGYEIPVMESRTGVTAGGSNTPAVIPVPAPALPIASTSAASMPTPASISTPVSTSAATPGTPGTRRRGYGDNTKAKVRKRPVYDDDSDVHRVSSGSETD
ncbi:hypothetical protein BYT27DRAFT_7184242 [Phlegmacium glaucopus]|nr:hypothetical protein BYT27DRAFT_7184242 [Phlegmacium glaucopus]